MAWTRASSNVVAVNTINTAASDTLGTQCTSASVGDDEEVSSAVADDGTVYMASDENATTLVQKLTFAGCTFTDITTGSGLTTFDNPVLTTIGNNLHMVYQDGDLSHSIYNGTSWTASNTQIAAQTDSVYSLTTDGTNLWLLTVDSTTAAALYKYNGTTWSTLTSPWTGQTNLTAVSLTYDSTNSDLYAFSIKDTTEQAYVSSSTAASISWSSQTSFAFSSGNLSSISSPQEGAGTSKIGIVLRDDSNASYLFSNLTPTKSIVVNGIDADADTIYSLTADGTNVWLLTVDSTTAAAFYKCSSCVSSANWSSQTSPWPSGLTNLTSVSLTYDSTNSDLYAFAIKDTSEQAYYISTDATTISWGSEASLAFTAGDLGHISSPETGAGTSQIAVSLRQGSNYEFALAFPVATGRRNTPIIGSIEVKDVTPTSAVLSWYTSMPVATKLTGQPLPNSSSQDADLKTWHSVSFANLSPGTIYSYTIHASPPGSGDVSTASFSFATLDTPKPVGAEANAGGLEVAEDVGTEALLQKIRELQLQVIQLCRELIQSLQGRVQALSLTLG